MTASTYAAQIEILPAGLERIVARTLSHAEGQSKAIMRDYFLELVHQVPGLEDVSDRQLRKAIENLRGQGMLICNLANGDGYYLAGNEAEYQAFRGKYGSYAFTILDKIRAMDVAAEQRWGKPTAVQPGLF
jgi:hypothetical protein